LSGRLGLQWSDARGRDNGERAGYGANPHGEILFFLMLRRVPTGLVRLLPMILADAGLLKGRPVIDPGRASEPDTTHHGTRKHDMYIIRLRYFRPVQLSGFLIKIAAFREVHLGRARHLMSTVSQYCE
jgi:hypothetical protein